MPYKAIGPAYQETGQPPWVARFLTVWVYLYATYQLFPLFLQVAGRCFLLVVNCQLFYSKHSAKCAKEPTFRSFAPRPRPSTVFKTPSAPKRNSPARAPRHTVFAIQYAIMGVHAGEVLARGGLEGTASPKEAAPPRSSSLAGIFSGGSLQGLL